MSSSSTTHVGAKHWGSSMKRVAWLVVFVLIAAGAVAAAWAVYDQHIRRGASPPPSPSVVEPTALGRLEPAGNVIDIGAMMGDRLVGLSVKEGDRVKKNQELATLDSRDLRNLEVEAIEDQLRETQSRAAAELDLAEARIASARLALEQSETRDAEIQAEELKLPVLRRSLEMAKTTRDRLMGLPDRLVSAQERERAELGVDKAKVEYDAAVKMLDRAKRGNELARKAADADLKAALAAKEVARSSVPRDSLEKKLELARAQRDRSVLLAPIDGTVLRVFLRPGELVGATPILQMANLDHMVVVAQVYESDVKRIRIGQKAVVTSRSFRAPYDDDLRGLEGKVTRIGHVISRPTMRELNPLAQTDRRALDVRIELDEETSKQAKDFVHMQVNVKFPVSEEPAKPADIASSGP